MRFLGTSKTAIVLLVVTACFAGPALADLAPGVPALRIEVCFRNMCYSAPYEVTAEQLAWNGTAWTWQLTEPVTMSAQVEPGVFVSAQLKPTTGIEITPGSGRSGNPQVSLGFAMAAADEETTFVVTSALLNFTPLTNPQARASAGISLVDGDGENGATLTGMGAALDVGGAYVAQFNGALPGGANFTELQTTPLTIAGASTAVHPQYPADGSWATIPGTVSSMQSQFAFKVSANDLASGTSLFQITPEPSALLLLGVLTLIRRR
jgi:hypothetical protein